MLVFMLVLTSIGEMDFMHEFKQAGGLNPEFGNHGSVDLLHTGSLPMLEAIGTTPSGAVLALSRQVGASGYWVSQFKSDGQLDKNFAGRGYFHANDANAGRRTNLHVLRDGSLLVAGGSENSLVISKYLPDGQLDSNYGTEGHVELPVADLKVTAPEHKESARLKDLEQDVKAPSSATPLDSLPPPTGTVRSVADGDRLYLVFNVGWGGFGEFMTVVVRVNAQGHLDTTFNKCGHVVITLAGIGAPYNSYIDAALQEGSQGNSLLVFVNERRSSGAPRGDRFVLRLNQDGSQDYGFGGVGNEQGLVRITETDFAAPDRLITDADGHFKIIGWHTKVGRGYAAAIRGYGLDGHVDSAFYDGQTLVRELAQDWGIWHAGVSTGSGASYQLVTCCLLSSLRSQMFAGRVLQGGVFDSAFGDGGVQPIDTEYSGLLTLSKVALHANGDILMGHHGHLYWLLGEESGSRR